VDAQALATICFFLTVVLGVGGIILMALAALIKPVPAAVGWIGVVSFVCAIIAVAVGSIWYDHSFYSFWVDFRFYVILGIVGFLILILAIVGFQATGHGKAPKSHNH
jgi:hypothetical protein